MVSSSYRYHPVAIDLFPNIHSRGNLLPRPRRFCSPANRRQGARHRCLRYLAPYGIGEVRTEIPRQHVGAQHRGFPMSGMSRASERA